MAIPDAQAAVRPKNSAAALQQFDRLENVFIFVVMVITSFGKEDQRFRWDPRSVDLF